MKFPRIFITAFVTFILFNAATFWIFLNKNPAALNLPRISKVADFHLLDQDAQPIGLRDLKGKVWVADFIYSTCSGICPLMSKNMAQLGRSFALLQQEVTFVSISVNPENDTPDRLKEYAKTVQANTRAWKFLTGPREEIQRLAVHSFKVGSVDEIMMHSAYFVLVDNKGYIRGYYEGTQKKQIDRLFKDIAYLVKEK